MPARSWRDGRFLPSTDVWLAASALWLLSLTALPSASGGVRPPGHDLASRKYTARAPVAMVYFLRSASGDATPPQAGNETTGAIWDVPSQSSPTDEEAAEADMVDGRDRVRTVLLTAGVVCGAVGVGLLAAAALAYLFQARRRSDGCSGVGDG